MKRVTVTISDELEAKLSVYLVEQKTPPSLNTVVHTALEEFLEAQKWDEMDIRSPTKPELVLPVSDA